MPFVSNQNCIEKFRAFGVNLENDIRFELVCYFVIYASQEMRIYFKIIAVLTNICVLVERRGKTVVRWNSTLIHNLTILKSLTKYMQGDSGGPLITRKSTLSPFLLVGVVSGGTSRYGRGFHQLIKSWVIHQFTDVVLERQESSPESQTTLTG